MLLGVCVFDWTLVWLVFLKSSGNQGSRGDDKGKEKAAHLNPNSPKVQTLLLLK